MHPTNLQRVQLTDALHIKPYLSWYIGRFVTSSQWLQPIVGNHWLDRVREGWRFGPVKPSKFVTLLELWHLLLTLHLLHVRHSLLHSLQHLSLHIQYLLQCWWWRWVGIIVVVVLIGTTVASVGHLMIVKRFEIEEKDRDTRFPTICIKV
jgi:hypothetical protein